MAKGPHTWLENKDKEKKDMKNELSGKFLIPYFSFLKGKQQTQI